MAPVASTARSAPGFPAGLVPERLAELRVPEGGSLLVVYGAVARVFDTFAGASLDMLDVDQAMWIWARAAGFERVLFSRPGRTVYSLGGDWERLLAGERALRTGGAATRQPRFHGPLGSRWLVSPDAFTPSAPPAPVTATHLTDMAAVDLLDGAMRDDTTRTALVFLHAEQWLRFSGARATFGEALSRWVQSPPLSGSLCVLIFPYEDLGDILGLPGVSEYPTLHAALTSAYRGREGGEPSTPVFRLGAPGQQEIARLVHVHRLTRGLRLTDWAELPALLRAMASARMPLRAWESRFRVLEGRDTGEPGQLSLEQLRARRWIPAHAAHGGSAQERLRELAGLATVKERIDVIAASVRRQQRQGMPAGRSTADRLNFVFTGNPGTGKTTVARLMGELLRDLGALPEGHLHELSPQALSGFTAGQARQAMHDAMQRARGGVLFIDEAYQLSGESNALGQAAITALNQLIDDERGRTSVIVAGYHDPMQQFLRVNPGLPDRFPPQYRIEFPDFSAAELLNVLLKQLADRGLSWTPDVREDLAEVVALVRGERTDDFGNARTMENIAGDIFGQYSLRDPAEGSPLTAEDIPAELRPADRRATADGGARALSRLDALVGLDGVKQALHTLAARLDLERQRRLLGMTVAGPVVPHMVFAGPPGTGKTTVAEALGELLREMGLLKTGRVHSVTKTDLVARYVGQTGPRTRQVINDALGGVLFIDEAHQLAAGEGGAGDDRFGREALDELALQMERHRGRLVVVAAGYQKQMDAFLASDPGLRGRFTLAVPFASYSDDELGEILRRMAAADPAGFAELDGGVLARAGRWLNARRVRLGGQFDNARAVRTLLELMKDRQAVRLQRLTQPTARELRILLPTDVPDD